MLLIATLVVLAAPLDDYSAHRQAALYDTALQLRDATPPTLTAAQAANRTAALVALDAYADAGVFPHNHTSIEPVPIFVDEHGTHCAVAQMIRASGDDDLVQTMALEDNTLRIDAGAVDARVASWAATHGFTLDELRAIQEVSYDFEPREPVHAKAQAPAVKQKLSQLDVLARVKSAMPAFQKCGPVNGRDGYVNTSFTIGKGGSAKDVVVTDGAQQSACIKRAIEAITFPKSGGETPVNLPLKVKLAA